MSYIYHIVKGLMLDKKVIIMYNKMSFIQDYARDICFMSLRIMREGIIWNVKSRMNTARFISLKTLC